MGIEVAHDVTIGDGVKVFEVETVAARRGGYRGDIDIEKVEGLFMDRDAGGLDFECKCRVWRERG